MGRRAESPELGDIGRLGLAVRRVKVGILQARRLGQWARGPAAWAPPAVASLEAPADEPVLHEARIEIARPGGHPRLEAGKERNLRLAAARLDGRRISAAQPFSFWRCVGRLTRERGFDVGAEVRAGCVVPTVGGGVCLVSSALFEMAVKLGWDVLERHGHTISTAAPGDHSHDLDATLFWPHVDLRFAPASGAATLGVDVRDGWLTVSARGPRLATTSVEVRREPLIATEPGMDAHRLVRVVRRADGATSSSIVGVSHKRRRPADAYSRNCLTCDEAACHARDGLLRNVR
jgi:vancomycin resistance protein VanW